MAAQSRREKLGWRGMLAILPAVGLTTLSLVLLLATVRGAVTFQLDFNGDLYLAGYRILHGVSPYDPQSLAAQASVLRAGGTFAAVTSPRYPATLLVAASPLSLLPMWMAGILFMLISLAAIVFGLRLLGVRDWRAIAVACISWPAVFGTWVGNVSPLMLLGCALAWRYRDRLWQPAVAVAAVVAAKLFPWPLGVWLIVTKRFRAFALALGIGIAATAAAWATIGFADLTRYPSMLLNVATIGQGRGCSLVAFMISLGIPAASAQLVALFCGIALISLAAKLWRLPDNQHRVFGLFVIASLVISPVSWAHYLVLLYVPIALMSPKLSGLWFLPMIAGLAPGPVALPDVWVTLPALTIELIITVKLCSPLLAGMSRFANQLAHRPN